MKIAGNLSFGKNISLVLLKNWLSFEFFRVFFALSFVKMLKKEAWLRHTPQDNRAAAATLSVLTVETCQDEHIRADGDSRGPAGLKGLFRSR